MNLSEIRLAHDIINNIEDIDIDDYLDEDGKSIGALVREREISLLAILLEMNLGDFSTSIPDIVPPPSPSTLDGGRDGESFSQTIDGGLNAITFITTFDGGINTT